ncbi:MAG: hypothetical protein J6W80_05230 [Kiritimatiellae bacterium]|nr:hypothetical protein [Kiritimatiellia bacterium]
MKKIMILALGAITAAAVLAVPATSKKTGAKAGAGKAAAKAAVEEDDEDGDVTRGKVAKIIIDAPPALGRTTRLPAPSIPGSSNITRAFLKTREWIVIETKYSTFIPLHKQLIFEWHVMLDAMKATEKASAQACRDGKLPQYSYFNTSVTYQNIPQGGHAASVCLHPSFLERYGEPCVVGLVIKDDKGKTYYCNCWAEGSEKRIQSLRWKGTDGQMNPDDGFWNDQKVMGDKAIERRQGLADRSKTIWALVNPNDYEYVAQ